MNMREKLEEDYERVKQNYILLLPEQIYQLSGEIYRKEEIYQYYKRYMQLLENVPDLARKIMKMDNLIEDAYAFLANVSLLGCRVECGMIFWLDSQMCAIRREYEECV